MTWGTGREARPTLFRFVLLLGQVIHERTFFFREKSLTQSRLV